MGGVENAATAAGIARLVIAIERERLSRLYRVSDVTNAQVRSRVMTDAAIGRSATYAQSVCRFTKPFASTAIVGTAFYLLTDVHPGDARDYMDRVCIGEELLRDSPAYAVRDALLSLGRGQKGAKLEAIFRGWVKHRAGEPLKIAKVLGHFPELD